MPNIGWNDNKNEDNFIRYLQYTGRGYIFNTL